MSTEELEIRLTTIEDIIISKNFKDLSPVKSSSQKIKYTRNVNKQVSIVAIYNNEYVGSAQLNIIPLN